MARIFKLDFKILFCLCFICALASSAHATPLIKWKLKSILNPGRALDIQSIAFKTVVPVECGDDWIGLLMPENTDASRTLTVEMKYRTVLSVLDKGPHLDLTDWVNYDSPWKPLIKNSEGHFEVREIDAKDRSAFPFVTKSEFLKAVKKQSAAGSGRSSKDWQNIAKQCLGPTVYPCAVVVREIFLRVFEIGPNGSSRKIQEIELKDMGC